MVDGSIFGLIRCFRKIQIEFMNEIQSMCYMTKHVVKREGKDMKKVKIVSAALITALVLPTAFEVIQIPPYSNVIIAEAGTIKLSQSVLKLKIKQTYNLKVNGIKKTTTWSSSKSSVASVSNSGKVTAKKKGTTIITATVGGKKYTCKVTVTTVYADGTYTGIGTGFHNGTTVVSVSVKNDVIRDISVISNQDTPRYYNYAKPVIISEILAAQSTNVDAVSGATYSSFGIMDAVANALSKAKN